MKKLLLLCLVSLNIAYGGTGVGSPFIQQLEAFDYQMAFPSNWKVSNSDVNGKEGLFKEWSADNSTVVSNTDISKIKIEFLANFPANSLKELYSVISKRHSIFTFQNSYNTQIQGWTSKLVQTGNRHENWEYYFIAPKQVVRIFTSRSKNGYGVSHVGIILNSIRKISSGIMVQKVSMENKTSGNNMINVGDRVCYKFIFDYPKELQDREMISTFKLAYERDDDDFPIAKKLYKSRDYEEKTGEHSICFKVLEGMDIKDHYIQEMDYEIDGASTYYSCNQYLKELDCNGKTIPFNIPDIINPSIDKLGPAVKNFKHNIKKNQIRMTLDDINEIKMIQLFVYDPYLGESKRAAVIFKDEIINNQIEYKFRRKFKTGSYISAIYFTDSSENTSALVINKVGDLKYSFKQMSQKIKKTNHTVIGW